MPAPFFTSTPCLQPLGPEYQCIINIIGTSCHTNLLHNECNHVIHKLLHVKTYSKALETAQPNSVTILIGSIVEPAYASTIIVIIIIIYIIIYT